MSNVINGAADMGRLVQQMQTQLRGMAGQAGGDLASGDAVTPTAVQPANFGDVLKHAIDGVNQLQQRADGLSTAFERGDSTVSLAQVMVSMQKATIAFQAMTEVRNRLVTAYQDVMSMPV